MGAVGILLVLFGYTLIYCGLKDIPVMQEIGYGLGLDSDPVAEKMGTAAANEPKTVAEKGISKGKTLSKLGQLIPGGAAYGGGKGLGDLIREQQGKEGG